MPWIAPYERQLVGSESGRVLSAATPRAYHNMGSAQLPPSPQTFLRVYCISPSSYSSEIEMTIVNTILRGCERTHLSPGSLTGLERSGLIDRSLTVPALQVIATAWRPKQGRDRQGAVRR